MRKLFTVDGHVENADILEVDRCFAEAAEKGFWLDIENPNDEDYHLLETKFKFHQLTIEDVKHQNQRPKVDDYPEYNFAVIFQADLIKDEIAFREHHLFVGPHYLVSVHQEPAPSLAELQERIKKSPELTKGQPAFLTYMVIDALVDATFPVLEELDETVDLLEDGDVQRLVLRRALEDEGVHQLVRRVDLAVLPVEAELLAVRGAVHEAVAPAVLFGAAGEASGVGDAKHKAIDLGHEAVY